MRLLRARAAANASSVFIVDGVDRTTMDCEKNTVGVDLGGMDHTCNGDPKHWCA
ncbi:MAG: hypothetical protein HY287_05295 [Planctomycetes bacterium]|nr:hypothetical protein [Planctomycetota bacterium]MBI3833726.1 hypothetical protein [Planctomycetota bacterium]